MSHLLFKDIGDWTPASISIVDVPYHSLAYFEVYEDDEEFIKKYTDISEVDDMTQNNNNDEGNVTVSGGFLERLLDKVITKSEPTPVADNDVNKEELSEKMDKILENQTKFDERITALESNANEPPVPNPDDEGDDGNGEGDNNNDDGNSEGNENTVELPLNDDGTLNLEDAVVAKYLPRGGNGNSQSVDPDLTITNNDSNKSFMERCGRDNNGMTW